MREENGIGLCVILANCAVHTHTQNARESECLECIRFEKELCRETGDRSGSDTGLAHAHRTTLINKSSPKAGGLWRKCVREQLNESVYDSSHQF